MTYADESHFNAGFDQGIKTASALQGNAMNAMKDFKPEEVIKHYTDNPKETNYQNTPDTIKPDAVSARNNDPTAKAINDSIYNHPKFDIKADSPEIKNITKRADDIYDATMGKWSDCTKETRCNTTYQTETCEEAPATTYQYCKKLLKVDVMTKENDSHYAFKIHLASERYYIGAIFDLTNGRLITHGPHDSTASIDGRLPPALDCGTLGGAILRSNLNGATIDGMRFPSCAAGATLDVHVTNRSQDRVNGTVDIDIVSHQIEHDAIDRWEDGCSGLAGDSHCAFKAERCVAPSSTHVIQGLPVARTCWEREATYQCGGGNNVGACEPLRNQGCEQIASQCKNKVDGGCTQYLQTFRCPIKTCTDVGMICNGQTYCLDGDCVKQQKQADPDFQKAVSALSAVHEAAKSFTDFNSIFAGVIKTCDKFALGFLNCCTDEGWGKDIKLAQCDQEEKDLGTAKENLQTVYVGEYCKKDPLGICIEHRNAYCVFPSKLARIIQTQGREGQLGIGFGDPENVDCRGLTREEFAQLDLSKIDFSDFYADITKKERIEDQAKLNQRMSEKMNKWVDEKKPNG